MRKLLNKIKKLKQSPIKKIIDARIKQFKAPKSNRELFSELCFCLLTANFQAEKCIEIQSKLNSKFLTLSQSKLAQELRKFGHRFPNTRAKYICEARKYKSSLKGKSRDWLVKNIKGLGYKEASHFLRNVGHLNYAIIDFHILNLLARYKVIQCPKNLTPKKYLQIENKLREIANKTNLSLGELDLYLWHLETGKVLK